MNAWYNNIPQHISPIAFSIGSVSVFWYSLMWICAFSVVYMLLLYRINKGERSYTKDFVQDSLANALIGALAGGRLGYVLFYDLSYYVAHPLQIISPYDFITHEWVGIYGMSYHGGLIGVMIALVWSARYRHASVLDLFDFIAPVVPLGYMFGRIGNFMNAELVGRITTSPVGMYFNGENVLRHPSQLYEACAEGLLLFVLLWSVRNNKFVAGTLSALYLIGYASARYVVEFFRAPDAHLGFIIGQWTMGQVLSSVMFVGGIIMLSVLYKEKIRYHITHFYKV